MSDEMEAGYFTSPMFGQQRIKNLEIRNQNIKIEKEELLRKINQATKENESFDSEIADLEMRATNARKFQTQFDKLRSIAGGDIKIAVRATIGILETETTQMKDTYIPGKPKNGRKSSDRLNQTTLRTSESVMHRKDSKQKTIRSRVTKTDIRTSARIRRKPYQDKKTPSTDSKEARDNKKCTEKKGSTKQKR